MRRLSLNLRVIRPEQQHGSSALRKPQHQRVVVLTQSSMLGCNAALGIRLGCHFMGQKMLSSCVGTWLMTRKHMCLATAQPLTSQPRIANFHDLAP